MFLNYSIPNTETVNAMDQSQAARWEWGVTFTCGPEGAETGRCSGWDWRGGWGWRGGWDGDEDGMVDGGWWMVDGG